MTALSAREQRLIAILILIALIFLGYSLVLAPLFGGFANRTTERDRLIATYQHNERLIASIPMLRRRAELQQADRARFALAAPTPLIASDRLKQRLGDRLSAAGGQLQNMGDSPAGAGWIGASIEGQLTLEQLTRLLADLQNQPPFLVVTNVTIVADRAFQSGRLDVMDVKIDVAIPYTRAA